jgi:serine/threonine protein kinase
VTAALRITTAADLQRLGAFTLVSPIGEGGMAQVFVARPNAPVGGQRAVVIKRIHPHLAKNRAHINMLLSEGRIAAQIDHPGVVRVFDICQAGNTYFIVMEFLVGENLEELKTLSSESHNPLSMESLVHLLSEVAGALHAAHEATDSEGELMRLVHRDVSPENIIIQNDGRVKLVDFGIAKIKAAIAQTAVGEIKGKLAYMSPEQINEKPLDRRSDVFSLGIVLWECLAGASLFARDTALGTVNAVLSENVPPPSAVRPSVPAELDRIVLRALQREPADRYHTARDFQVDMVEFLRRRNVRRPRKQLKREIDILAGDRLKARGELRRCVSDGHPVTDELISQCEFTFSGNGPDPFEAALRGETVPPLDNEDTAEQSDYGDYVVEDNDPTEHVNVQPAAATGSRIRFAASVAAALALLILPSLLVGAAMDRKKSGKRIKINIQESPAQVASTSDRLSAARATQPTTAESTSKPVLRVEDLAPRSQSSATQPIPDAQEEAQKQPEAATASAKDSTATAPPKQTKTENGKEAHDDAEADQDKKEAKRKLPPIPVRIARAKNFYMKGATLFVKGKFVPARAKFRAAISSAPAYAPAYRGLGLAEARLGRKNFAIRALRTYLRLAPKARDATAMRRRLAQLGG